MHIKNFQHFTTKFLNWIYEHNIDFWFISELIEKQKPLLFCSHSYSMKPGTAHNTELYSKYWSRNQVIHHNILRKKKLGTIY